MVLLSEPLGVICVISPFNFPVLLGMKAIIAALLSGNAVVQKPSGHTPPIACKVREIYIEAGLPEDLYQIVTGGGSTGAALLESGVDHIYFVGSTHVGRKVAQSAGEKLISTTLELGGNNAMTLLEDAPLDRAAEALMTYAFGYTGQMCGAISRVFVHESHVESFLQSLKARIQNIRTGTDTRPGRGEVTALIDQQAFNRVDRFVKQAVERGARCSTVVVRSLVPLPRSTRPP
jgi:acyl-CoA reductase-like NAD-dependent aldehyde dehydrogenase